MPHESEFPPDDLHELLEAVDAIRPFDRDASIVSRHLRELLATLGVVTRRHDRTANALHVAASGMAVQHAEAAKVHGSVLDALLARGWCHSYHFTDSLIIHLGGLVRDGKGDEIDELMAEFARRECDRIRTTACEKYPARAGILADTFDAHAARKYTLSIPAFLSQLDGIGCDMMGLGRYFFSEKKRTGALNALVSRFKWPWGDQPYRLGGIHERMLGALERAWGVTLDTNERGTPAGCSPLNRHGVLHGVDTDYPSEFNSLRCILLLGFVLEVRRVLHEDIPQHLRELGDMTRRAPA